MTAVRELFAGTSKGRGNKNYRHVIVRHGRRCRWKQWRRPHRGWRRLQQIIADTWLQHNTQIQYHKYNITIHNTVHLHCPEIFVETIPADISGRKRKNKERTCFRIQPFCRKKSNNWVDMIVLQNIAPTSSPVIDENIPSKSFNRLHWSRTRDGLSSSYRLQPAGSQWLSHFFISPSLHLFLSLN